MGCCFAKKNKWPKRTLNPTNQVIFIEDALCPQYYPLSLRQARNIVKYNSQTRRYPLSLSQARNGAQYC